MAFYEWHLQLLTFMNSSPFTSATIWDAGMCFFLFFSFSLSEQHWKPKRYITVKKKKKKATSMQYYKNEWQNNWNANVKIQAYHKQNDLRWKGQVKRRHFTWCQNNTPILSQNHLSVKVLKKTKKIWEEKKKKSQVTTTKNETTPILNNARYHFIEWLMQTGSMFILQ